jgi:aminoglycoside phosphotransferase (APT) family kinase protein
VRTEPGTGEIEAVEPRQVGEGWDNTTWIVGGHRARAGAEGTPLVLRVPRRAFAEPLLALELQVLRHLGGEALPLQVPRVFGVVGSESRPVALLLSWHPGVTSAQASADAQAAAAQDLARMLAAVHRPAPEDLAASRVRGVPLAGRGEALCADCTEGARSGDGALKDRASRVLALWDRGENASPWDGPPLLLHGDPHPGNLVLGSTRTTTAAAGERSTLIDWGDTTPGDPASDLGALLLHDPASAEELLAIYRDCARWDTEAPGRWTALHDRAWAWAVHLARVLLSAYALEHPLGAVGDRLLDAAPRI